MSRYENLPSINLEVLDGNLKIDTQPSGDAVIIVGTALKGPVNVPLALIDSNIATRVFGANSPLLEATSHVKLGGVQNVYLYRIGGVSAKITGLFGAESSIEVVEPSIEEEQLLSMYVGPRPLDATKMCLIVYRGTKIVYSNAPGAEVDLKVVLVSGFDPDTTTRVGTIDAPVPFSTAATVGGVPTTTTSTVNVPTVTPGTATFTGDAGVQTYTITGENGVTVTEVTVSGTPVAFTFTPGSSGTDATVTLTDTLAPSQEGAPVVVSFTKSGSAGFVGDGASTVFTLTGIVGPTVSSVDIDGTPDTGYTFTPATGSADAFVTFTTAPANLAVINVNYTTSHTFNTVADAGVITFTIAGVNGATVTGATVDGVSAVVSSFTPGVSGGADATVTFASAPATGSTVVVDYTTIVDVPTTTTSTTITPVPGVVYTAADNSINASWNRYYELVDRALAELETTQAGGIYVHNALLDAPNIADGSTATDKLEYLNKVEDFGDVTYEWSSVKKVYKLGAGTTTDEVLADKNANGLPIIVKQFNEVNFAHRIATWSYYVTENENFVFATVGTSAPASIGVSDVARWIGTLPQVDDQGNVTVNGSGLLGNKFMNGSTTRTPGFILTDTGFPDGNPVTDSNGALIDLGKFMSIVPAQVSTVARPSLGLSTQVTSGAPMYAGLIPTIRAGESTTNRAISNVSLPYTIKKAKLNELAGSGYVMFTERNNQIKVVSGDLATRPNSDYDYISTSIILAQLITRIRTRLDPYLGKGLTSVQVAAMNTAVEGVFEDMVRNNGAIVKYAFSVLVDPVRNGAGIVRIPITIVPAFELREVNTSVKLAYDI